MKEDTFYFYDAAAPIIEKDSIDFTKAYYKSRYDKGEASYINCPMNEEEFHAFYDKLIHAEVVSLKHFEDEKYFEGCMPFEEMARRGKKTLLFGPMKPVGLEKPDGTRPYAVVQLRQDDAAASLYNIVGFQTHLTWPAQREVLRMIPGLEQCNIVRYGVMHGADLTGERTLCFTADLHDGSNGALYHLCSSEIFSADECEFRDHAFGKRSEEERAQGSLCNAGACRDRAV